jgi:hypothetical protein
MWIRNLAVVLALVALGACGGKQVDTTIPLNEARTLNNDLSAAYVRVASLMESVSATALEIGALPAGVRATDFDVALVREVLLSCFTTPTGIAPGVALDVVPEHAEAVAGEALSLLTERPAIGRVEACDPPRMIALEAYLDVVSGSLREFLLSRTLAVDTLRVDLKDVAIAQLDALERRALGAAAESAELRALTEERHALAQTRELDESARQSHDRDYDMMIAQLDEIDALLDSLDGELSAMRAQRRTLVEEVEQALAAMGTAP